MVCNEVFFITENCLDNVWVFEVSVFAQSGLEIEKWQKWVGRVKGVKADGFAFAVWLP